MTKIVYNGCYGGFSLSKKAVLWLAERGHEGAKKEVADREAAASAEPKDAIDHWSRDAWANGDNCSISGYSWHPWGDDDLPRSHPLLVECVETLGDGANGSCASLCIRDVPAGTKYRIDEYDGNESVMTVDDYEWETA
jgi:hypothetical protein